MVDRLNKSSYKDGQYVQDNKCEGIVLIVEEVARMYLLVDNSCLSVVTLCLSILQGIFLYGYLSLVYSSIVIVDLHSNLFVERIDLLHYQNHS